MCQSTTHSIQSKYLESRDLPLVTTRLRTFTIGRESKRKNSKDSGFTCVRSTNTKTMQCINLWKRWKQDTGCKQALYCKWLPQHHKYIMEGYLCGQEHFPRINTGSRGSPVENLPTRKWMLYLWASWRLEGWRRLEKQAAGHSVR